MRAMAVVLLFAACHPLQHDEAPSTPDGGCPDGFTQVRDVGAADLDRYPDGGCLRSCIHDSDCAPGNRCSVKGFFAGGDYQCNREALVCRNAPDDCPLR